MLMRNEEEGQRVCAFSLQPLHEVHPFYYGLCSLIIACFQLLTCFQTIAFLNFSGITTILLPIGCGGSVKWNRGNDSFSCKYGLASRP